MERKELFGVKFWGVGGREVQAPMASFWLGGSVGRRVRRDVEGSMGCLWMYWEVVRDFELHILYGLCERLTMCGLSGNVETVLEARRCNVGVRKPCRMQRVVRAKVLDSIVNCYRRFKSLYESCVWAGCFNGKCRIIRSSRLQPHRER
jgi:hypothetical protein